MILFHSLVNVAILALLLLFAFQYQTIRNKEAADARYTLASYLFASNDHTNSYLHQRIETIDEFVGTLESIVRAYYAVPTRSRGLFMHYTNSSSPASDTIAPPTLFLQYHLGSRSAPSYSQLGTKTYALTLENPTGPFVNSTASLDNSSESCTPQVDPVAGGAYIPCRISAIGGMLDRVALLRLTFSLFARSRRWAGDRAAATSSTWDVAVDYGFEGHKAVVTMTIHLSSVSRRQVEQGPLLLCWAVGLLAFIDMCVRLRVQVKEMAVTSDRDYQYDALPGEEEGLGKAQMISPTLGTVQAGENGWRWMGYLSNVAVFSFATVALVGQHKHCAYDSLEEAVTLLLAFAAMLSSFRIIMLLKLFPAWYVFIDGLTTSLQQLAVFVVGVLPVLMGYALCGTAMFGGMGDIYFQSIPNTVVTLLCSMFGDNLLSTFLRMDQSPHWLQIIFARVFILTFLALFVCNILSIAHSIIQDSYSQALKSYASTMTAAAEAAAVAQQRRPSGCNDRIGAYEKMSGDERGVDHDRLNRPDERTSGRAVSTAAALASRLRSGHSPSRSSNARRQAVPPFSPHEVLRADEVKRMLSRLERISL
ncbi:hypothetical protein, conserved [Leishmania tarentolae]|uniref:Polycystin cation channel PKD1/PKD2 domain-containing protein n=1 Tax=Leishmania tarentolae TaxID=5689 RepID=A0A640KPR6_LEITA|nr:hypothetical protein, conserved [Leishmania tarentolae]